MKKLKIQRPQGKVLNSSVARSPFYKYLLAIAVALLSTSAAFAQQLPRSIDGYKVDNRQLRIAMFDNPDKGGSDAIVKLLRPELSSVGLSAAVIEVGAEITSVTRSGHVDRVNFRNVSVNGLSVTVADYLNGADLIRGRPFRLVEPVRIIVPATSLLKAAYRGTPLSSPKLVVEGRAFIFATIRKYGFRFRRVVPVDFKFSVDNPLSTLAGL